MPFPRHVEYIVLCRYYATCTKNNVVYKLELRSSFLTSLLKCHPSSNPTFSIPSSSATSAVFFFLVHRPEACPRLRLAKLCQGRSTMCSGCFNSALRSVAKRGAALLAPRLWERGSHKLAHCWEGCLRLRRGRDKTLRCFIEKENISRKRYATDRLLTVLTM